jgi:hypothetical protein
MKDVSPFTFNFLPPRPSLPFPSFVGEAPAAFDPKAAFFAVLVGEPASIPFLGPFSLF